MTNIQVGDRVSMTNDAGTEYGVVTALGLMFHAHVKAESDGTMFYVKRSELKKEER